MDEELEGINLETNNPNNEDVIILPSVDNEETSQEETTETTETKNQDTTNNNIDEQKEALQRGVNKERQLRKAAEKKNKELEARIQALEEANNTPTKSTVDELIEKGVDESIAKSIATAIDKKNTDSNTKQELADLKFKISLTEKSKESGFEDILDYEDEIKDLVDKGLTLEQSYYAITYSKPSINTKSEIERKVEAKIQNNIARREILGNNLNSNSGVSASKTKISATAEEKAIAAAAGMTVEEYVTIRDLDSAKEYNDYKSKKK